MKLKQVNRKGGRIYTDEDDNKYASVTSLLNIMYPFDDTQYKIWCQANGFDPAWILAESNRIGSKVHGWIENNFHGVADLYDIAPRDKKEEGYREAVSSILNDFEVIDSEYRVATKWGDYGYAGTVDSLIRRKEDGKEFLNDFKTWGAWKEIDKIKKKLDSKKVKKVAIQTGMYATANGWEGGRSVIVPLPDGTYVFRELKDLREEWEPKLNEALNKFFNKKV